MAEIAIIDYQTREVHIYEIPNDTIRDSEWIEEWICENTEHSLSDTQWVVCETGVNVIKH